MNRRIRVMLATLLVVTGVLMFVPSSYVSAGGIICNPGFEEGAGDIPASWNMTGNATRVDTGPIYGGNWTARIAGNNDTLTQWLSIGNLSLPVTFEAWGWLHVSGEVTAVIAIDFWQGVNGSQVSSTTELSANFTDGGFVQRSGMLQAPVGANCTRIRLMGTGWHEGAEVRFDDIGFWPPVGGFCFVATAAYGTETAAELDTLRDFRDDVLLRNALGSRLVEAYYRISPPIADFIARNDFLRAIIREMLIDPIVDFLQWSQELWRT